MNTIPTETLKEIAGKLAGIMPETVLHTSGDIKSCLPNISEVESFCGSLANQLHLVGEDDLAKSVIRSATYYVIHQSGVYHRDPGSMWSWYKSKYGSGSPCCCCDWQSDLSYVAKRLGFDDVSAWVVSHQCPASPSGYRREPCGSASPIDDWVCKRDVNLITTYLEGKLDFFSR
jgi:hypothetical protein